MTDNKEDRREQSFFSRVWRPILSVPLTILILLYFLFDDLFLAWLRPLFAWAGRLKPFEWLAGWLKRLPPYAALGVFLVPFILLEPFKILGLFLIAFDHLVSGTIMLATAHLMSLLIVERLFHVTRDQLLSIGWFAWGFALVMQLKAWAFERVRASWIWRLLAPPAERLADVVQKNATLLFKALINTIRRAG